MFSDKNQEVYNQQKQFFPLISEGFSLYFRHTFSEDFRRNAVRFRKFLSVVSKLREISGFRSWEKPTHTIAES